MKKLDVFKRALGVVLFALTFGFALSANAEVYKLYCSPDATGAASEDCLTPETAGYPKAAIDLVGTAIPATVDSDEVQIVFLPGTYHLQAGTSWWASGESYRPSGIPARLVLTSSTGDFRDVTLDFDDIINPRLCYANVNVRIDYCGLTFTHIECNNQNMTFCDTHGNNTKGSIFDGCRFLECLTNPEKTTAQMPLCTATRSNIALYRCVFDSCGRADWPGGGWNLGRGCGFLLFNCTAIYDCLFVDNSALKVDCNTYNCTFLRNRSCGYTGKETAIEPQLFFGAVNKNNILIDNVLFNPRNEGVSATVTYKNLSYSIVDHDLGEGSDEATCVRYDGANVVLAMAPNGYECVPVASDLNLAVELGENYEGVDNPTALTGTDLLGNPRLVGSNVDAGCCEVSADIDPEDEFELANGTMSAEATFVPSAASDHPAITVTDKSGAPLAEGVDYRVVVRPSESGVENEVEVVVVGVGDYHGTLVATSVRTGHKVFYAKEGGSPSADCLSWATAGTLKRAVALASDPANGGESWENPTEIVIEGGTKDDPVIYTVGKAGANSWNSEWCDLQATYEGSPYGVSDYVYLHTSTDDREGTIFAYGNGSKTSTQQAHGFLRTTGEWKVGGFTFDGWSMGLGSCVLDGAINGPKGTAPTYPAWAAILTNVVIRNSNCNNGYIHTPRIYDVVFDNCQLTAGYKDAGGFVGTIMKDSQARYAVDIDGLTFTNCTVANASFIQYRSWTQGRIDHVTIVDCQQTGGLKGVIYNNDYDNGGLNRFVCTGWKISNLTGVDYLVGQSGYPLFIDCDFSEWSPNTTFIHCGKPNYAPLLATVDPDSRLGFVNCTFQKGSEGNLLKLPKLVFDGAANSNDVVLVQNCTFDHIDFQQYSIQLSQPGGSAAQKRTGIAFFDNDFVGCNFASGSFTVGRAHSGPSLLGQRAGMGIEGNNFEDCTFALRTFYFSELQNVGVYVNSNVFANCTLPSQLCSGSFSGNIAGCGNGYTGAFELIGDEFLGCSITAGTTPTAPSTTAANGAVFSPVGCTDGAQATCSKTNTMCLVRGCVFKGNNYVENSCGIMQRGYFEDCTFEDETFAGSACTHGLILGGSAYRCTFTNCGVAEGNEASAASQQVIMVGGNERCSFLHSCKITGCTGGLTIRTIIYNTLIADNTTPAAVYDCDIANSTVANNSGVGCASSGTKAYHLRNVVAYGNGSYDIQGYNKGGTYYSIWGTADDISASDTSARGNLPGVDPKFVDAESGDYHLADVSPANNMGELGDDGRNAINAQKLWKGGTFEFGEADLDGEDRVFGELIDMGAYENQHAVTMVELEVPSFAHADLIDIENAVYNDGVWSAVPGATVTLKFAPEAGWGLSVLATSYIVQKDGKLVLAEGEEEPKAGRARIGGDYYDSLADAITAVGDGETIELLVDIPAAHGISVPSDKNFTVDFGGFEYLVEKPGAGSPATKTQAFQLLAGSTIVFKNGTIGCTEANRDATWDSGDEIKGVAMIIQNYANLTLENMTIDGANIAHNGVATRYVMSNNSGTVVLDNSVIIALGGDFAFDTCKYRTYEPPSVSVENDTAITGDIELSGGDLALVSGTLDGELVATDVGDGVITKEDDFEADAPEGYKWKDGVLVERTYVAKIGEAMFMSLADAITAVGYGETIEMLDDVDDAHGISVPSGKNFIVDFGGFTYLVEKPGAGSPATKTQAFQLLAGSTIVFKNGTIGCTEANREATWESGDEIKGVAMIIQNYANLTLENMTIDGANIAHNGVATRYVMSNNSGTVVLDNSVIIALGGDFAFDTCKYRTYDPPSVSVENGSEIIGKIELSGGNLALVSGRLDGEIVVTEVGEGVITKSDDFEAAAPSGYCWKNGVLTVAVARIDGVGFASLADAITAVGYGETIELLADVPAANGISVPSGKNFTVDFGGFEYLVEKPGAGSPATKTQAFQLLEGSTIVFRNGTIGCTEANREATWESGDAIKGVAMIIQNYADLTLENMKIDGANIAHNGVATRYVMSNNSGTVVLDNSVIIALDGDFAFDTCKYRTYEPPSVSVENGTAITGDIELSGGDLALVSGTLDGELVATDVGDGVITKEDDFAAEAPAGYKWKNGVLVERTYVAKIDEAVFESLADAIAAVGDGETIKMLADVPDANGISVPSGKNFTVDFGGFMYLVEKPGAGSPATKTQAFQLLAGSTIVFKNGTIGCTEANREATWGSGDEIKGVAMIIQNYANLTLENMKIDGANIAHNGVATRYVMSNNSGTVVLNHTVITAVEDDFAFDTCKYRTYEPPSVSVENGSEITGKIELSGGDLALVDGTLDGELVATDVGDGVITKEDGFEADAPAGYKWDEDGVLVKAGVTVVINPGMPDEHTETYDNFNAAVAAQIAGTVVRFSVAVEAETVTMKPGVKVELDPAQTAGVLAFAKPTSVDDIEIDPAIYVEPTVVGGKVELKLDAEAVAPTVSELALSEGQLVFTLAAPKASIWYAIEAADTPDGEYVVDGETWVRCTAESVLAFPKLTPAEGRAFFRVVATDVVP